MSILYSFQEGGVTMYAILLCALLGNPLSLLAIGSFFAKHRGVQGALAGVALAMSVGICLVGVGGYAVGMSRVEAALAYASPEDADMLYEYGRREAMNNLWFGACGATLPLLLGGAALVRTLVRRAEGSEQAA